MSLLLAWILRAEGCVDCGGNAWSATSSSGSKTCRNRKQSPSLLTTSLCCWFLLIRTTAQTHRFQSDGALSLYSLDYVVKAHLLHRCKVSCQMWTTSGKAQKKSKSVAECADTHHPWLQLLGSEQIHLAKCKDSWAAKPWFRVAIQPSPASAWFLEQQHTEGQLNRRAPDQLHTQGCQCGRYLLCLDFVCQSWICFHRSASWGL